MPVLSPVALRQLHATYTQACSSDRFPGDVYAVESSDGAGYRLFYRNAQIGVSDVEPCVGAACKALRSYFRTCLTGYLLAFGARLSELLSASGDIDLTYSVEHELTFFDEDDSSTHIFLVYGDTPRPFSGEVRLHSHLAKASLSLAAGDGLPEISGDQLLSGFDRFVFADVLDSLVSGVASRILGAVSINDQAAA